MRNNQAFTLVELIVVITILAILGTIAFLSFQGYSSSARDSVRTEDIVNISKGLELLSIERGTLPIPVNGVALTSGTTTVTQGTINNSILPRLSSNVKDTLTGKEYRYSILGNGQYYQVLAELENPLSRNISPIGIDTAYAASTVTPSLRGNYTFDPSLPSLFVSSGSTLFDPNNCFVLDKGTNTLSNPVGCTPKKSLSLKDYDSGLVGYWDMETLTGTKLADLSGNGNDGTFNGGMNYGSALIGGMIGNGMNFTNKSYSIEIPDLITGSILDSSGSYSVEVTFYYSGVYIPGESPIYFSKGVYPNYNYKAGFYPEDYIAGYKVVKGGWYQYVYVFDFNDGRSDIYLNGKLIKQGWIKNGFNNNWITNNDPIVFGRYIDNLSYSFIGTIDDTKLYNIALSNEQISQHARAAGF